MRKIFLLFYLSIAFSINADSLYYSYLDNSLSDTIRDTSPIREVQATPNGFNVRYIFNSALIQEDYLFEGSVLWKISGFQQIDEPGKPSLPIKYDQFALPDNVISANISVRTSVPKTLPFVLSPARPPLTESDTIGYSTDNIPPISPYYNLFPNTLVENKVFETYRGRKTMSVRVSPIQYNYSQEKIVFYDTIIYAIQFARTSEVPSATTLPIITADDNMINNTMLDWTKLTNPSQISTDSVKTLDVTKDYLILSVPKYEQAVDKFAQWKRYMGFNVHKAIRENWTPDTIKSVVKQAYTNHNRLYYLLIVGDHEDVPAEYHEYTVTTKIGDKYKNDDYHHYSDLYYGCMDGVSDSIPDIYRGRLSVSSLEEANIVVDKIINYEKNPPTSYDFYNTGLHCAYFQDDPSSIENNTATGNSDKYEDRRFVLTSEEVRNYLIQNYNKVIPRLYEHIKTFWSEPMFWNKLEYSTGGPIPMDLRYGNYPWNVDTVEIMDIINSGVFYILYRGHGNPEYWANPYFSNEDIRMLSNGNNLPVVFNITCSTGTFNNTTCFAEELLRKQEGGAVGVFAASRQSFSGYNDAMILGIMDAIWPTPGLNIAFEINDTSYINTPLTSTTRTPIYAIGQIFDQGLLKMTESYGINQHKRYSWQIFHCFGDPSMEIRTEVPTSFDNLEIAKDDNIVCVDLGNDIANITFYNKNDNTVQSFRGRTAIYDDISSGNIAICISAHNKIPIIIEPEQLNFDKIIGTKFIQNTTVSDSRLYKSNILKIGNDVTTEKAEGPVSFESGSSTTIEAKSVVIESNTIIEKGSTFKITTKNQ